jgi:hypothetical protein
MAIEFICPSCQGTLSMPDDAAGRLVRCGSCLATLRVPDAPADSAPPAYELVKPPRTRPAEPVHGDRDEHGEPLPRGKRKRKSRRSPLFWIVVVLLTLGLFTCLACGGVVLILATPRWHEYDSQVGGYTVQFPARMNPNIAREAGVDLKLNETLEGAALIGRAEYYWVWHTPFDGRWRKLADDEAVIDEVVKHMTKNKGEVEKSTRKKVDGCAAREVVIQRDDGQVYHCMVVVGKSKLYIVAAGGPFMDSEPNERVRHFLDNFHVK